MRPIEAIPLRPTPRPWPGALGLLVAVVGGLGLPGCGDGAGGGDGAGLPVCEGVGAAYFDRLPIDEVHIGSVQLLGQMDPPGDPLPESQSGFTYADPEIAIPIRAPGDVIVTSLESTRWIASPTRQGLMDYSLVIHACRDVYVGLAHIARLAPRLAALFESGEANCEVTVGTTETVESCSVFELREALVAGEAIGEGGGATALGLDFDAYDRRADYVWANPDLYPPPHKAAICMHELFTPDVRAFLEANTNWNGQVRTRPPLCGTHAVDVMGTAQGAWVTRAGSAMLRGDVSDVQYFLALAPHFVHPDLSQVISPGMSELGEELWEVANDGPVGAGRTDVPFSDLPPTGAIHCYAATRVTTTSFFVALTDEPSLTVERIVHADGASPCADDPSTWAFSAAAVEFVR